MDLLPTLGSLLDEHGLIAIFDALGELCAQRHEPAPPPPETKGDLEPYRKGSFWGF